jgi:hypothetical protein
MITMQQIDGLRFEAGITLEDSFESGSKYQVGDRELVNLVKLAKQEAYKECVVHARSLMAPKQNDVDYVQSAVNITCETVAKLIESEMKYNVPVI